MPTRRLSPLAGAALATVLALGGCSAATAAGRAPGQASGPPPAAAMVCGDEVKGDAAELLGTATPPTTSTWDGADYTCTYALADGPLTLSVHVADDQAAAHTWADQLRGRLPATNPISDLGQAAYGTGDGLVVVVKDGFVLQSDTTRLPAQVGAGRQTRDSVALAMAMVVMGCWTGTS